MIKNFINKKNLSLMISTLFYIGYFPIAPGTVASLASLPIIFLTCYCFGAIGLIFLIILSFFVSMLSIKEVLLYTKHDPSFIVIDEFIGQSITFLLVADIFKSNINFWWILLIGFVLFRLFDVKKPFPVSYADKKIKNAFGVILDDIFAGVYSTIFLYIILALVRN